MLNIVKKFKIRIVHYHKEYYTIQYAHYYLIPNYNNICYWFEASLLSGLENWSAKLFKFKDAEQLARTFNSIQDIENWQKHDQLQALNFKQQKQDYLKQNIPYNIKNIK